MRGAVLSRGSRSRVRSVVTAALAAAAAAAALVVLIFSAVHTASGQLLDQWGMDRVGDLRAPTEPVVDVVLTATPTVSGAVIVGAAVWAASRRRVVDALTLIAVPLVSQALTQLLKTDLIERQTLADGIAVTMNSFPSGHVTLAAAAGYALIAAAQPRRLARGALALAWTAAVGLSTLLAGWHRPSDIVGAVLVVAAVAAAASLVRSVLRKPRSARVTGVPARNGGSG